MKITKIETFRQQVELTEPFKISFRTITAVDTLIVKISTDAGLVGFGEANPLEQVTAESVDTEQVALDFLPIYWSAVILVPLKLCIPKWTVLWRGTLRQKRGSISPALIC